MTRASRRSPRLVAVACLLAACSRGGATSPPERALDASPEAPGLDDRALRPSLEAELATELARRSPALPAGVHVRLGPSEYLSSVDLPHAIPVQLHLPVADDALARETVMTLDVFSIEPSPAPHVASRPSYASLASRAAAVAPRALTVLGVARAALKGLSAYRGWQRRRRAYHTYLLAMTDDLDLVHVYFSTPYVAGEPDVESPVSSGFGARCPVSTRATVRA